MSGPGQVDQTVQFTENPPNDSNRGYITSFSFADAVDYDTISWIYTNTDTDGSRARFMGVILDGLAPVVPEPSTFAFAALGLIGLFFVGRRRKKV